MMACNLSKANPTIYIMSQIPNLYHHIKKIGTENIPIKALNLPEMFQKDLTLNQEQIDFVKDAEILVGDCTALAKVYHHLPNLKWAHCTWAGVEPLISLIEHHKTKPSFILTKHALPSFSSLMAEYVICQILNWERNMISCWKAQQQKTWMHSDRFAITSKSLNELVVCILGVGNMGCGVAKQLKNWGSTILGFSRTPRSAEAMEYLFFNVISTDLTELLPKCDYLVNTLPNTPQTSGFLNGNVLNMCAKKPVFINVGRGSIIKEQYIIQAIRNKWLSGAVLDVFEEEPLPKTSELWDMPEVIITPHIAAMSTPEHVAEAFMKNYNKYIASDPLENIVNWSIGY